MNGPCGKLAHGHPVKVVFGPGTFVNEAANQIDEQLASQSKQAGCEESLLCKTLHVIGRRIVFPGSPGHLS